MPCFSYRQFVKIENGHVRQMPGANVRSLLERLRLQGYYSQSLCIAFFTDDIDTEGKTIFLCSSTRHFYYFITSSSRLLDSTLYTIRSLRIQIYGIINR